MGLPYFGLSTICHHSLCCFLPDGPVIIPGRSMVVVVEGQPAILTCATEVRSNPEATVTWITPSGEESTNSSLQIRRSHDSRGIRLEVYNLTEDGVWMCEIRVEGRNVLGPSGVVFPSLLIGEETVNITVIVAGKQRSFFTFISWPHGYRHTATSWQCNWQSRLYLSPFLQLLPENLLI